MAKSWRSSARSSAGGWMLAEHQRAAVTRVASLLERYGCALLADEPGLGKSYVAAAVAREYASPEVIVPASLVAQWRATLREFGVTARVVTFGTIELGAPAPDLVIVDEAHAFRNPHTRRYQMLARRTETCRVMLVSATPVCNGAADLQALLALVAADDVLLDEGIASIDAAFESRDYAAIESIVATLVIRRDRDVLPEALRFGELERRVIRHPVPHVQLGELRFPLVTNAALLRRFLERRLESSVAALLESLRRQRRFYERALESLAGDRVLTRRDYRRAFAHEEDREAYQQVLFWDLFTAPGNVTGGEIREEIARVDALIQAAEAAPDEKRSMLSPLLGDEPALIFTTSAATARDLARHLRCGLVTARDGRDPVEAFRRGAIDTLVSTDLAAEGLNLQRAGLVVHYDIPWNPVKLDQRNGRAHRIGQRRPSVRAVYFLPEKDETRIVATMTAKNRVRRRVLGVTIARQREESSVARSTAARGLPRPRVTTTAAAARLARRGIAVPEELERRNKAGVELRLLESGIESSRGSAGRR
jgi:superfamily II DNA or RNA helicase